MKNLVNLTSILLLSAACAITAEAQQYHSLTPLSGFGPSGSGAFLAGDVGSFITTDTSQRGMTYNPVTGHLIFVDRQGGGNSAEITGAIYVLDANTGAILSTLTTNGIQGGTVADLSLGVADDGAIYMANLVTSSADGPLKIYRWSSETTTDAPTLAYSGDPTSGVNPELRWGDSMDVRGSGATTEIIMGARVTGTTTRSALFTTSDGLAFTNLLLTASAQNPAGGIAFGDGNTFWIKRYNTSLRKMSYDSSTGDASFARDYAEVRELLPADAMNIDLANGLIALIDWDVGEGQDRVYLYSIANSNDVPQLMDSYTLPVNNANGTGTPGFLAFGAGKLYAHSPNNGLFAFNLSSGPVPAPTIITNPLPSQVLEGGTASLRVIAQRANRFQWYKNNSEVPGATNSILTIPNVPLSASGDYTVRAYNDTSSVLSDPAKLEVLSLEDFYRLTPLWGTAPGTQPYFVITGGSQNAPNQRSFAYNALSNHIYVVARAGSATTIFNVFVVDADTGEWLYNLNTNGMSFAGQIGLVSIEVAEDGSIYACNADASASAVPNWKLYRWADGNSNTVPQLVFDGDPIGLGTANRWGDSMAVRGGGINTEILVEGHFTVTGYRHIAILKPTDSTLSSFTGNWWFSDMLLGTAFSKSLQFGPGNTFWQKRLGNPLVQSSYDPSSSMSLVITNIHVPFGVDTGPAAIDTTRNLVAVLNISAVTGAAPDTLDLYDISTPTSPVFLSRVNFPVNEIANNAAIGKVIIAGDRVFGLMEQNGLVAARLEIGAPVLPPVMQISKSGGDVIIQWEGAGFTLEGTSSLATPSWEPVTYTAGTTNVATETVPPTGAKFYRLRK
jgi:hypothetical protein